MAHSVSRYAPRLVAIAEELLLAADDWVEPERLVRLTEDLQAQSDCLLALPRQTQSVDWGALSAELRNASMYSNTWTGTPERTGVLYDLIRETRILEIIEELAMNADERRGGARLKRLLAESYGLTGFAQSVSTRLVFDDLDWDDIANALGWSFIKADCWSCNGQCAMALADLIEVRRSEF